MTIDVGDEGIGRGFNVDAFNMCFIAAIKAASRWNSLVIYSLPRLRECKAFQILPPLKHLKRFWLFQGRDLCSSFESLMIAITTTATPHLTRMTLQNLNAVLYLVQPDCLHVFCSLTSLTIWLFERMGGPANILPHLQRLERFDAAHLYLPVYPPDAPLPLIQTLRSLNLKYVSVQWMAGKVFPALETCSITSPHQIDTLRLQPVTMPACDFLTYDSNDLDPLRYLHNLPLTRLKVTSGQWNVTRGNPQLMVVCHMLVPHAQCLTWLDLQVRCSGQLLAYMLSLLPALILLKLRLSSPCALSRTFFQAFVAPKPNTDGPCKMGGPPSLPLCSKLTDLEVVYKRWLRDPERTALLQVFGDIVSSRRLEKVFRLHLTFDYLDWFVSRHVESIHVESIYVEVLHGASVYRQLLLGITSPHGIIPLVLIRGAPLMEAPFKEVEYLVARHQLSIGFLLTLHHLVELRVGGGKDILPSEPPANLPLFHTLRVLEAPNIHPSFLAGQTFHKLERCRMSVQEGPKLSKDQVTQMPACTRLDVGNLPLLATLKLPQICELGASFDHPEFNMIWEAHIAVNTNLSGLEILHVYGWYQQVDLIQALRCLPVLKSLILANGSGLNAAFFRKFVQMRPNATTGLMRSHDEGRISAILCPVLRNLLIEGCSPTQRAELIPILKHVFTLRAVCGSPLEKFTLSSTEFGKKFELIGNRGGFVAETISLDEDARPFRLDI